MQCQRLLTLQKIIIKECVLQLDPAPNSTGQNRRIEFIIGVWGKSKLQDEDQMEYYLQLLPAVEYYKPSIWLNKEEEKCYFL